MYDIEKLRKDANDTSISPDKRAMLEYMLKEYNRDGYIRYRHYEGLIEDYILPDTGKLTLDAIMDELCKMSILKRYDVGDTYMGYIVTDISTGFYGEDVDNPVTVYLSYHLRDADNHYYYTLMYNSGNVHITCTADFEDSRVIPL